MNREKNKSDEFEHILKRKKKGESVLFSSET